MLAEREHMKRLVLLALIVGCTDTKPCPVYNAAEAVPAQELRDPTSGQCEAFGGGGPPCDNQCGPCAYEGAGPAVGADPDWGSCSGPCSGLDEMQCLASTTCHPAYTVVSNMAPTFSSCWDLPPSGAITGACTNLDAQTCSEHPDCETILSNGSYANCAIKVAPPTCSALTTEADCKARTDCDPIYIGMNCTCDSSGCTCATETYDHCQSR